MRIPRTNVPNIGFGVALAVLGGILLLSHRNSQSVAEAADARHRGSVRLDQLQEFMSTAVDIETGQRGYVVTGDKVFLAPYLSGMEQLVPQLQRLHIALADDPRQQPTLATLEDTVAPLINYHRQVVALKEGPDSDAARRTIATGRGKQIMDQIRQFVAVLRAEERKQLQQRDQEFQASLQWSILIIIAGSLLGFVVVALATLAINRTLRERDRLMENRQSADEARQHEADRYRSLVDATTAIVWNTSASGEIECDLPGWTAFTGQLPAQIQSWGWLDAVHPDDRAQSARAWSAAVATQSLYHVEHRLCRHDGEYRHMLARGVPIVNKDGRVVEWVGVHTDITEQKNAQVTLREHTQLMEAILNSMGEGVVVADVDGRFLLFNPAAEAILGVGLTEASSDTWSDVYGIFLPDTKTAFPPNELPLVKAVRGEATDDCQMFVRNARVPGWHIAVTGRPMLTETGAIRGGVAVFRDITARKHAEARLNEAMETAESANRAKSEFLAHMSHEIRTPMNGILGMTELMMDTPLSPEQREYLTLVKQSADALLRIINDILDFSKIEAGKMQLDREEFFLRETVGKAMRILALRADEKKIELAIRFAPDVPDAVLGDADHLRQIIINLAGNAIKFTERGEVVVDVNVESQTSTEVELHFSVADTGVGIPPEKQEKLFQAFQQLDGSNTRRHGGTGLGLVIAQRLVQLMGGRIWFESKADRGTIFHFVIKLEVGQHALSSAPPFVNDELTNLPVLIADDNATNRRILHEILLNWHLCPVSVDGGPAALKALEHARQLGTPFRLLLVDARMPEMDGFVLVEKIQQGRCAEGAVFIILSSADQPGDRLRCKNLGVNCYLVKPVQQEELREAILVALGKKAAAIELSDADRQKKKLQPAMRSLRILLAEDQLINQRLAVRMLEKRGHSVVVAMDGREALNVLACGPVDLVLMDMQMPEMDGFETTRNIRQLEERTGKHLPVIAMTAFAIKGDRERCLAAGCDDYLTKPIDSLSLYEIVETLGGSSADSHDHPEAAAPRSKPMEPTRTVWDRAAALARVDGDEGFLRELAELFVENCPGLLAQLAAAIQERDPIAIAKAAHTIQGNVASLNATASYEQARLLEEKAKVSELEDIEPLQAELQRRLDSFVEGAQAICRRDRVDSMPELVLADG